VFISKELVWNLNCGTEELVLEIMLGEIVGHFCYDGDRVIEVFFSRREGE